MSQSTIAELERNIQEAKNTAALAAALERLKNNVDFKKVILEGYLEQEAIRLVHLKADDKFQSAEMQKSIVSQIDAVGQLVSYFNTTRFKGEQALRSIGADEETLEELRAEAIDG